MCVSGEAERDSRADLVALLKQLDIHVRMFGAKGRADKEISLSQLLLLDQLFAMEQEQEIFSKELGQRAGLSRATVSHMLKRLKRNGYLEMAPDEKDNRRKRIVLTPKAHRARRQVRRAVRRLAACLCRGIPEEELNRTKDTLQRMLQNLQSEGGREESGDI